jgi:putative membrane protein
MNKRPNSWRADGMTILCGLSMGCADVVPGVSGGTVALILGIYERLVTAISRFDRTFVRHVTRKQWLEAATYIDLRFLVFLAIGLGSGIVAMSLLVNRLLADSLTRSVTFAAFSGMILASSWLVSLMIRPQRGQKPFCLALGLAGVVIAWWASSLTPAGASVPPSLPWLFVCGSVAICAMILPGISGALMLLVLGVYAHLTEIPHNLLNGEELLNSILMLLVFGSGCAVGLVSFSKVLKWLLARHHALTMSLLCGFMLGGAAEAVAVSIGSNARDREIQTQGISVGVAGSVWRRVHRGGVGGRRSNRGRAGG